MAKKRTKCERFLGVMEAVVPWMALIDLIESDYPKTSSKGGRPAYPLATMLRIHLMQQWYSLSDPAMEDALIEVPTMRRFKGIDLISVRIPDETTILAFRLLLEKHNLGELPPTCMSYRPAAELIHGEGEVVYADADYQGIEKRPEIEGKSTTFRIAMRPGKRRVQPNTADGRPDDLIETAKSHIRAKGDQAAVRLSSNLLAGNAQKTLQGERAGGPIQSVPGALSVGGQDMIGGVV